MNIKLLIFIDELIIVALYVQIDILFNYFRLLAYFSI